eukprot:s1027_g12.t4
MPIVEDELDESKQQFAVGGESRVMRIGNTYDPVTKKITSLNAFDPLLPPGGSSQYRPADRKPAWHTDSVYRKDAPIGSLLYCRQTPPEGGATCFADTVSALAALPAEKQEKLKKLECLCSQTHHDAKINKTSPDFPTLTPEQRRQSPAQRVPMVLEHPLNKRLSLYGMNGGTCRVLSAEAKVTDEELDRYELEALEHESVQEEWRSLLPFVTDARFTVKWEWQVGDLVLWDNRCTMHCATGKKNLGKCDLMRTQLHQNLCPQAHLLHKPKVFSLDVAQSDIDPLKNWVLKPDASCEGTSVCHVALAPQLDPWQPITKSRLVITVLANCSHFGQQLFLCPADSPERCAASLMIPARALRPHHLFSFLISSERMQKMDSMRSTFDDILEAIFVFEILAALGSLLWLASEVIFSAAVSASDVSDSSEVDGRLKLWGAMEVMGDGLLNALCFLLGCLLWILASSQFLHKYGSQSSTVDTLILCIPAVFGPCALLRLFLSISRRQLYYTLFRRRILLALEKTPCWKDGLLLCSILGLALGILSVIAGVLLASKEAEVRRDVILTQLLVFLSPLYTMVSAFLYELDAEATCVKRQCTLQLQELEMSTTDRRPMAVTTQHTVQLWPERAFCDGARKSQPGSLECLQQPPETYDSSAPAFAMRDMMWANRLVCHTSENHKVSLLVFMPVLMICILSLSLGCTVLSLKHRSDMPQLLSLEPSVGTINPSISPDTRHTTLYVDILRRSVSLESSLDLSQTTSLQTETLGAKIKRSAKSKELKQSTKVNLHPTRASYPIRLRFATSTRAQVEHYDLQIFQVTSFIRSLLLSGETVDGRKYQRCVFGNTLLLGNIGMPPNLRSLTMEVTTLNIPYGIPIRQAPHPKHFTTVFRPAEETEDCEAYCFKHANCFESKVRSLTGCFFIFAPSSLDCLQLHQAEPSEISGNQVLRDLDLKGELCKDKSQKACTPLTSTSPGRMQSEVLDPSSLQIGNLALKTHVESNGSNFFMEGSQISLHNGTPPVNTVLAQSRAPVTIRVSHGVDRKGFEFEVTLAYDPTAIQGPWNGSFFDVTLAALVEDPNFHLQWTDGVWLTSEGTPTFQQCQEDFLYSRYQVCGGPFDSPMMKLRVNAWAPRQELFGRLIPSNPDFFESADVRLKITTPKNLEPLQALIRQNCSALPICLGGFYECLETAECKRSSKNVCAYTCSREAYANCKNLTKSRQFVAAVNSHHSRLRVSRLGPIISVAPTAGMKDFFTYPVVKDIAGHCGLHSGLWHLVSRTLKRFWKSPQKARAMQIVQQLSFNPDFKRNETAKQNHLLQYLSKFLPVQWMPFRDVVLYSHEFAPLQFAFCSAVSPLSVTPELLAQVTDKIAAVDSANELHEKADWQLVLRSLIQCARRGSSKRSQRNSAGSGTNRGVPALQCRRQPNMTLSSLFALAPDETTFEILLSYCDVSQALEEDGSTVLHLAAARGWCSALGASIHRIPRVLMNSTRSVLTFDSRYYTQHLLNMTAIHEAAYAASPEPCRKPISSKSRGERDGPYALECLKHLLLNNAASDNDAAVEVMGHTIGKLAK